ncbi:MAG TPA: hypothetical protein VFL98_02575 [Candidatus Paceibacterota bacterium]|nr:hypothetical protein [Candidatus Paceibacterota bacterium]
MAHTTTDTGSFDLKNVLEDLFKRADRLSLPDIMAAGNQFKPAPDDATPVAKLSPRGQRLNALLISNLNQIEALWCMPERDAFMCEKRIIRLEAECTLIEHLLAFELTHRFADITFWQTHRVNITEGYDICSTPDGGGSSMTVN